MDQKQATLQDIVKLLNDSHYREACFPYIQNQVVKDFWLKEYDSYPQSAITPVLNKIGAFLSNPAIKRVLVDNTQDISFRWMMDNKKILIINVSKGRIGEDASNLLGSLFFTALGLSGFSRQDIPNNQRIPFMIYCDEFQTVSTLFIVNALSELRKYKIGLILANQYLDQLKKDIRDAVLGNIGTLIVFRTGFSDARYLTKEFDNQFSAGDITNLEHFDVYARLMVDGRSSQGFSASINYWDHI